MLIDEPFGYLRPKKDDGKKVFTQIRRDPDVKTSIFDDACFKYYLMRHCETIGYEAMVMILQEEKMD